MCTSGQGLREDARPRDQLGLPPGTAVLVTRKSLYDTDNRLVEMSRATLPGDRTRMLFTTHLERW
ncbi:UTRA domain-containing protein [Streptomyces sp. NPDC051218]|uniref:UTRA domain-containing protein n=1 Tax=Streptomyces sp. NPDC051218 TaxID=3365645 RepID=UPI0037A162B6